MSLDLETLRKDKDYYSSRASDIGRQLAFAGIAVVWIFKYESNGLLRIPDNLILPVIFFVLALATDFLHYVWGAFAWALFHRVKEFQDYKPKDAIHAPAWLNYPTTFFFIAKLIFVFLAYYHLLLYLFDIQTK